MTTCCVAVIGHVDHGKTTLVKALTGQNTDRLAEEQARGLSIVPGYAHATYGAGTVDFVDVPGHEDFVPAMIRGAAGAAAVLVVISMVDGIAAQTHEHLAIAGMLGINRAIVALTHADRVDPAEHEGRMAQIGTELKTAGLADASIIVCSPVTGLGIAQLHAAIAQLLEHTAAEPWPDHAYLPVDRVFSLPGRGTVVTGTLRGGALYGADSLRLEPAGMDVAIRGLHSRGEEQETALAGARVAVNLRGVSVAQVERGSVLMPPVGVRPSTCMDLYLAPSANLPRPIKHMQQLRVFIGTAHVVAQLRLIGARNIAPGGNGFAQIRLQKPQVGFAGQRIILRGLSPAETLGGGIILDPLATPARIGDDPRLTVLRAAHQGAVAGIAAALIAQGSGIARMADVARLARVPVGDVANRLPGELRQIDTGLILHTEDLQRCQAALLDMLAQYHRENPLHPGMAPAQLKLRGTAPELQRHALEGLKNDGQVSASAQRIALSDHDPMALLTPAQRQHLQEIEAAIAKSGLQADGIASQGEKTDAAELAELLLAQGKVVRLHNVALDQTLLFHTRALSAALMALTAAYPHPEPFTTSQARIALKTSRRVIVPVLEYLDQTGATQRTGNTRQVSPKR